MTTNHNLDDHYKILGVSENATFEEIKAARNRMVFEHHPDKNPDNIDAAHNKTIAINLAYEIISNDEARRNYDAFRKTNQHSNEYAKARARYQESEYEARERVKKWVYENLNTRPTKKHKCYTPLTLPRNMYQVQIESLLL
jgi:curved DNA-binding protein CbpA